MDPAAAAYAAYGYGDAYGGATATDPNDPYAWQWAAMYQNATGAQAQVNKTAAPMQQHQQVHQMHQQSKPFGMKTQISSQKPNVRAGMGGFGGTSGGGEWMQPPSQKSGFPSKQRSGVGFSQPAWKQGKQGGFFNNQSGFGQWKKKPSNESKKLETAGKTPAMLLHELFRNITEDYEEVSSSQPKKYRCILTVSGQQFAMESPNKKTAKQKAAEMAVRALRPDINVTPFEDGVATLPITSLAPSAKRPAAAMEVDSRAGTGAAAQAKKAKLAPVDGAASLLDLMRKLIAELPSGQYNPGFETTELPQEVGEARKKYKTTLSFPEQNHVFTRIGTSRAGTKDVVIREALQELFHVSPVDVRRVVRRQIINKISVDVQVLSLIHQVCELSNCEIEWVIDTPKDVPLGTGPTPYVAVCKITDHSENDKVFEQKSEPFQSKSQAKEAAAVAVLKEYFNINPETLNTEGAHQPLGPLQVLHEMLHKKDRKTKVAYEFKDQLPGQGSIAGVFPCECIVNGTDKYIGTGRSKKLAKNASAIKALKEIFSIDFDPNVNYNVGNKNQRPPSRRPTPDCSQLCLDISEYTRREYFSMCKFFNLPPSTLLACFYLVNEKDEKRLLSIGSASQYVVDMAAIKDSYGSCLIHLDPIVLARRSLIRYLMQEVEHYDENSDTSIFDRASDGLLILKPNLRLVMYSVFPPHCGYSTPSATTQRLSYVTPTTFTPVGDEVQTTAQIHETGCLRVHATSDKVFKWSQLGVQGALLSTLIHPILPNTIFFGSSAPVSDDELRYALFGRLGESKMPVTVESMKVPMRFAQSAPHIWSRGIDGIEVLDHSTGRTNKGSPSRICKAELFETYRKLPGANSKLTSYEEAKRSAWAYQEAKKLLYQKMEEANLGKWQKTPTEITEFTAQSFE